MEEKISESWRRGIRRRGGVGGQKRKIGNEKYIGQPRKTKESEKDWRRDRERERGKNERQRLKGSNKEFVHQNEQ